MSATPRIFLVFEGAWLEVDASLVSRRGGIRIIAREAESKWNLQPNLYEFLHSSEKVDSPSALQRAVDCARNGVCKLEISERLEGRMMRTMNTEMKRLEERVMAKVDAALADVRKESEWSSTRLSGSIAPLVQCLAEEQIELRSKLGQLSKEVNTMTEEKTPVATEGKARVFKGEDALENELQQECTMQAAWELDLATSTDHEELKKEVSHLSQKQLCEAERPALTKLTMKQDNVMPPPPQYNFDTSVRWPIGSTGIPYSSKAGKKGTVFEARWNPGDKWSCVQLGDEVAAPFAQSIIAPQLYSSKSAATCRSCPLLPPLQ